MMEVARTSETLVNYQTTRRYNPEDSHLPCYNIFIVICILFKITLEVGDADGINISRKFHDHIASGHETRLCYDNV
jgi:hypothetical protein